MAQAKMKILLDEISGYGIKAFIKLRGRLGGRKGVKGKMQQKRSTTSILVAIAAAFVLSLTAYGSSYASGGSSHWGYEGEHGPSHWGSLSHDYAACSEGKKQSPIDITEPQSEDLKDIEFNYKPSQIKVINNGHTVQVNYDEGSYIEVNGSKYQLLQFHFHTPSEHTVGGKSFGMELHLVHKNDQGALAVVGVLLEPGSENAAFKDVWASMPERAGVSKIVNAKVDANKLLPEVRQYYTYSGSLTTPPCSEGVTWLVLKAPVQVSKKQLKKIHSIIHKNNRPVQPLNDRDIKADSASN